MSGYYYKQSEPRLWTVGNNDERGKFYPESDHPTAELAARRVAVLNGGGAKDVSTATTSNEQLAIGIMAAMLMANPPYLDETFKAVEKAREIMDTVYKTEPEEPCEP